MAVPFSCGQGGIEVAGMPSNLYTINLVNGVTTLVNQLTPEGNYNAIGYSVIDNYVYGYNRTVNRIVRISSDATAEILPAVPNLPINNYSVGDVDLNGYLYIYFVNTARFYVVDVNPSRSTYLQLVDPANNFQLQTSDFGVPFTNLNMGDWAFNPVDKQLYTVSVPGNVIRIDPITGGRTTLATSGIPATLYESLWYDIDGYLYAINVGSGEIYRITTTATTATGIFFSQGEMATNTDGARCPLARTNLISALKSVDLTQAVLGDTLTYTIIITNNSPTIATTNVIFTDPIPNGTTYVLGSATVNGSPAVGDPATGITIGNLGTSTSVTVEFQVDISDTTLPYPNPIPNTATITYNQGAPVNSNTVFTRVNFSERGINFI